MNAGDVWKYGKTIHPDTRYGSQRTLTATTGLRYVTEFRGGEMQALIMEKFKLYGYYLEHKTLPPGNCCFR